MTGGIRVKQTDRLFLHCAQELLGQSLLWNEAQYIQHGVTSTLLHSLAVAYFAWRAARFLRLPVAERSLIRGALLHDYFLYDWHDPASHDRLHGPHHPRIAWENAIRDLPVPLDAVEKDVILKHMFPVTLALPACRESIIVCLTDKLCAVYESVSRRTPYPRMQRMIAELEARGDRQIQSIP